MRTSEALFLTLLALGIAALLGGLLHPERYAGGRSLPGIRMLNLAEALFLAGAVGTLAYEALNPPAALRATFIGNMGVHLTDGRVAVLVDFPYESGAFGYMTWSKDLPPAGPAPLCVFTHSHADHFAPALVADRCGQVLGPKDVAAAAKVRALELKPEVRLEGITLRPIATPHGSLEHYSYVVEWGKARLYFTGDTDDATALLAARDLNVAFVSPWLLEAVHKKGARIDARQVVVYHHRADETVPEIQGRILPRQGQVLSFEAR